MAWNNPITWTAIAIPVTTANQQWRDNLLYLKNAVDTNIVQTDNFTGPVNNFSLTSLLRVLYCTNATLRTYTGFVAGIDGQRLLVISKGTGQVDFAHQSTSSTAANRLNNIATSGVTSLYPGSGRAEFEYDATAARWQLLWHQQGAWITPSFNASHYSGNVAGWTVDAADVSVAYWLKDRTLLFKFNIATTTVAAGGTTGLQITNGQWGSYGAVVSTAGSYVANDNAGGSQVGLWQVSSGTLILFRAASAAWSASTNATGANGSIAFEVQ